MNDRAQVEAPDLRRVEEIGLNALQTQQQLFYDGWLLRLSPGKAKRARSVNAFFGSTLPLSRKIAHCERVYAEHGLPLLFRITPFVQPSRAAGRARRARLRTVRDDERADRGARPSSRRRGGA